MARPVVRGYNSFPATNTSDSRCAGPANGFQHLPEVSDYLKQPLCRDDDIFDKTAGKTHNLGAEPAAAMAKGFFLGGRNVDFRHSRTTYW